MEGYAGEIRALPYNFVPEGWMVCGGQYLPIEEYQLLFAVIGVRFGGDGRTSFALPNMSSRVAVSAGKRQGAANYVMGDYGGLPSVTLYSSNLPKHTHQVVGANIKGASAKMVTTPIPNTCYLSNAMSQTEGYLYAYANESNCIMSADSISVEGKSIPHTNMMPYMAFRYCICYRGYFAQRS